MFKNAEDYLKNRIKTISSTRKKLREDYNRCQIEIVEIDNQIKALSNQIDMAYEIFSPKSSESTFNHKEIKSLEAKKIVTMQESIDTHKRIVAIDSEIKTINAALKELSVNVPVTNEGLSGSSNNMSETERSYENMGSSEKISLVSRFETADNQQPPSSTKTQTSKKSIEDVAEKLDFCVKIFDFDPQRVKIEILEMLNRIYKQ